MEKNEWRYRADITLSMTRDAHSNDGREATVAFAYLGFLVSRQAQHYWRPGLSDPRQLHIRLPARH